MNWIRLSHPQFLLFCQFVTGCAGKRVRFVIASGLHALLNPCRPECCTCAACKGHTVTRMLRSVWARTTTVATRGQDIRCLFLFFYFVCVGVYWYLPERTAGNVNTHILTLLTGFKMFQYVLFGKQYTALVKLLSFTSMTNWVFFSSARLL